MNISLRNIDEHNFLNAFRLELADNQTQFVSHPIRSLAQAYVYRSQCIPLGVYRDDTMVGYLMVLYDHDEEAYNIWHVMIDKNQQGRGYGRQAMVRALELIAAKPLGPSGRVLLCCAPENRRAYGLYRSLGFVPTGRMDEEEEELGLTLP